jgi:hypothetical protein
MAATHAYLFGRVTCEKMAAYWSAASEDDSYARHLKGTKMYVASRTLQDVEGRRLARRLKLHTGLADRPARQQRINDSGYY